MMRPSDTAPSLLERPGLAGAEERVKRGLLVRGLAKTFPGVQALCGVDLAVEPGSVHALLGHNGCGKSTLVKTLAGYHSPDPGALAWIDGAPLELGSAESAARGGIRFVHQELGLVSDLSAIDNVGLSLGYSRGPGGLIRWKRQAARTAELLKRFQIDCDAFRPLSEASPVERTAVAIVRAVAGLHPGRGLLVLDEPTASLPVREVETLFRLIMDIRDTGTAVLLISHRLDEVMSIADHATVLRAGREIWSGATGEMSVRKFATLIAGEEVEQVEEAAMRVPSSGAVARSEVALSVRGLRGKYLAGVDLDLHRGEILGIAGLLGSGREELPYAIAGASSFPIEGEIFGGREPLLKVDVNSARALGIVLVPADRAHEGVVGDFAVRENVSLASLPALARGGLISRRSERRFARNWLSAVGAVPAVSERPISTLSGGNQQKAVLARWLSVAPKVLAVSEPTAGIDVGARATIYEEMRVRADDGLAVLMSSSDAEDLIATCDRVLVLRDGLVACEISRDQMTKSAIVAAMEGAHGEHDATA